MYPGRRYAACLRLSTYKMPEGAKTSIYLRTHILDSTTNLRDRLPSRARAHAYFAVAGVVGFFVDLLTMNQRHQ